MDCLSPAEFEHSLVSANLFIFRRVKANRDTSAVNEIEPVGNLQSFIVGSDSGLTLVDTVSTGGSGPTFTSPLSTGEVTAMNVSHPFTLICE